VWVHSGIASTLFEDDSALAVTLAGPLSKTLNDASADPDLLPYTLLVGSERLDVSVRPRGSSRRAVCKFPPLQLQFNGSDLGSFGGQHRLKLVTHCNSSRKAEQNVLEEYLAYRILGVLTKQSFRVSLLKVTYRDSQRPQRRALHKWAFVIEDVDAMSERLGGKHVEPHFVAPSALDRQHAALMGLFQFLIGNTDYSLNTRRPERACCHNTKLIALQDRLLSIPYDFDQAGLVDADYAGANPVYAARNVRTRHYLGICSSIETLRDSLALIESKRDAITSLIDTTEGFTDSTRKRTKRYLDQFFGRIAKSGVDPLHERLHKRCQ